MLNKTAFTLVELMIAVAILSVGIVGVLRSFLSVSSALDELSCRLSALNFLESNKNDMYEQSLYDGGFIISSGSQRVMVANRSADFSMDVASFLEEDSSIKDLAQVDMRLQWKKGNKLTDEQIIFWALPKS